MPQNDPILDEIHAVREAIAEQSGYDAEKIAEAARQRELLSGRHAVTLPPRPPVDINKKAS